MNGRSMSIKTNNLIRKMKRAAVTQGIVTGTRGLLTAVVAATLQLTGLAPQSGAQTVPTNGIKLWLKADAGVKLNGDRVTRWTDNADPATDATQKTPTSQPVFVANALNGKPVLRFDGIDDALTISRAVNGNTALTVIL